MKITVYGAEGEIGQKVISYALSQGATAPLSLSRSSIAIIAGFFSFAK